MIRIVTSSTLVALREQADEVPGLRRQLATAQAQAAAAQEDAETARGAADAAQADAEQARAALKLIEDDRVFGLAALRDAVRDPDRAPSVRGLIAVRVLRGMLEEEIARRGEVEPGLRFLGMLLSDDTDDGSVPAVNTTGGQLAR